MTITIKAAHAINENTYACVLFVYGERFEYSQNKKKHKQQQRNKCVHEIYTLLLAYT